MLSPRSSGLGIYLLHKSIHCPLPALLCTAGKYISQTPLPDGLWVASGDGRRGTGKDWRVGGGQGQCVCLSPRAWVERPAVAATSFGFSSHTVVRGWVSLTLCGPSSLWAARTGVLLLLHWPSFSDLVTPLPPWFSSPHE